MCCASFCFGLMLYERAIVAPVESSTPSSPDINVKVRAEHDPRSSFLTIRAIATPGARNRRKFSPQTLFYSSPPPLMPYEAGKKGATKNLKNLYIPGPRGSSARRVRQPVARNGACTVVRKYSCGSHAFPACPRRADRESPRSPARPGPD